MGDSIFLCFFCGPEVVFSFFSFGATRIVTVVAGDYYQMMSLFVLLLIVAATASAPTPSGVADFFACVLLWLLAYTGWLWLSGVVQITSSNELDAAMASSASLVVALLPARCGLHIFSCVQSCTSTLAN